MTQEEAGTQLFISTHYGDTYSLPLALPQPRLFSSTPSHALSFGNAAIIPLRMEQKETLLQTEFYKYCGLQTQQAILTNS